MDYTVLDGYKSLKKKNDLSNAKKEEFSNQIKLLLTEEGFSEKAEEYLFSCFSIMGLNCLIPYLDTIDVAGRDAFFESIIKSEKYKANEKNIGYKIAVSLFGLICNKYYDSVSQTKFLVRDLPHIIKNKEGKYCNDAEKIFAKYFGASVNINSVLPDLYSFDLNSSVVDSFRIIAIRCINVGESEGYIKPYSLEILKKWLNVTNASLNEISTEKTDETSSEKKNQKSSDVLKKFSQQIAEIANQVSEKENRLNDYKALMAEKDRTNKELSEKNDQLEKSIQSKDSELVSLKKVSEEDKEIISKQESEISFLKDEIEKMKSVVTVYSDVGESAVDEKLNAVASKLKSEYRDFMDSIDMEMSIDLGENLRYQLKSVFKILSKAGIDVGGNN